MSRIGSSFRSLIRERRKLFLFLAAQFLIFISALLVLDRIDGMIDMLETNGVSRIQIILIYMGKYLPVTIAGLLFPCFYLVQFYLDAGGNRSPDG